MLRRRHYAQKEAAGEAKGREEKDAAGRLRRGAAGGVYVGVEVGLTLAIRHTTLHIERW